jgi:hypothetical protein
MWSARVRGATLHRRHLPADAGSTPSIPDNPDSFDRLADKFVAAEETSDTGAAGACRAAN